MHASYEMQAMDILRLSYYLSGFTSFLLAHPDNRDKQDKLLAEIDSFGRDRIPTLEDLETLPYLDAVFKESLRLYPPAYLTTREAEEDFFLDGIPGMLCVSCAVHAHS